MNKLFKLKFITIYCNNLIFEYEIILITFIISE